MIQAMEQGPETGVWMGARLFCYEQRGARGDFMDLVTFELRPIGGIN